MNDMVGMAPFSKEICGQAASNMAKAPDQLHTCFDPTEVRPWSADHFEMIGKVQDAVRNRGQVDVMRDNSSGSLVAVKRMPNEWVRHSHSDFVEQYPLETELPWQDIGCNQFLSSVQYPYGCRLLGVYRGDEYTAVVTELATEGDLFSWCGCPTRADPGPERERLLYPLARQIIEGVQTLHEMSIVHRDLSLENLVMSKVEEGSGNGMKVQVIDFGMASTVRKFRSCVSGKPSYQAPELHDDGNEIDAFLTDAFAVGVSLYSAFMKDYPWLSTKEGGCKCFDFYARHGFRKYISKRKIRGTRFTVASAMSEELVRLLEGLLAIDPAERLTLGESSWVASRRSAWDEPWVQNLKLKDIYV
eukprot:CAMPEP_0168506524 /NCGR_PEP_ID=MMETSP0228-20121227/77418_1 /TAXON_ID=133427 /ORGANISM="Protoceratium reticulatum, Strain CCCM 535 (=CCMP 1889)" /LENGTH=358 /DNA_ID=CAMNT_0008523619 /DNA_START=204 /DNA_END=1280 /DNA_ORIENTATION=-